MKLVELAPFMPEAVIDLRYATADNFTGKVLYPPDFKAQLAPKPAQQLAIATQLFVACSFIPKIWDAYRPDEVQRELLKYVDDPRYVASPEDSRHPKGEAVDMTLLALDGQAIDMGTDYDDFSERAHNDYVDFPARILANRRFMANIMAQAGFQQLPTEWWHFDYIGEQ